MQIPPPESPADFFLLSSEGMRVNRWGETSEWGEKARRHRDRCWITSFMQHKHIWVDRSGENNRVKWGWKKKCSCILEESEMDVWRVPTSVSKLLQVSGDTHSHSVDGGSENTAIRRLDQLNPFSFDFYHYSALLLFHLHHVMVFEKIFFCVSTQFTVFSAETEQTTPIKSLCPNT